jgi:hypothetical protein
MGALMSIGAPVSGEGAPSSQWRQGIGQAGAKAAISNFTECPFKAEDFTAIYVRRAAPWPEFKGRGRVAFVS